MGMPSQLVQCHDTIFPNPTSISQAVSVDLHLLDVPEHPNRTPDSLCVSVTMNFVTKVIVSSVCIMMDGQGMDHL
jgi:hypothetical protein